MFPGLSRPNLHENCRSGRFFKMLMKLMTIVLLLSLNGGLAIPAQINSFIQSPTVASESDDDNFIVTHVSDDDDLSTAIGMPVSVPAGDTGVTYFEDKAEMVKGRKKQRKDSQQREDWDSNQDDGISDQLDDDDSRYNEEDGWENQVLSSVRLAGVEGSATKQSVLNPARNSGVIPESTIAPLDNVGDASEHGLLWEPEGIELTCY
ncbi:hypothetical protein NDU88_001627 [Pleurodeles waltl]|uniref:Uncharacterized protein n=1 Tax=Pleurodeles waltl TaxID=8319 RepID=A0AAV7SBF3_PLEWA|nr:hypothetical protein NDU88_001627 [Pleurodeles waltl]